jgi:hypothetical protein
MANVPPVVRNTLSKKLEFSLIFSSVNQFLHQLDALKITKLMALKCSYNFTSLSPIIDNNQISHKVSSLNVAGEAFPESNRGFQPGEIFNL